VPLPLFMVTDSPFKSSDWQSQFSPRPKKCSSAEEAKLSLVSQGVPGTVIQVLNTQGDLKVTYTVMVSAPLVLQVNLTLSPVICASSSK
jgi:hypothetical protein